MAKALASFTITPSTDGFELRIEDDSGAAVEVLATEAQMDVLAEELNRALDAATLDEEDLDEGEAGGNGAPDKAE